MIRRWTRELLARTGLTGPARRLVLWLSGTERVISIDGSDGRFVQRDFGDYIELGQVANERALISRLSAEIEPDDVFLDVGSNLGVFAVFVGDRLDSGTVICVEPVPDTAAKLDANLERNGIDGKVCQVAFSDRTDELSMTVPDSHGSSALDPDGDDITVSLVPGDQYLADSELPSPTVVKIDVEGHEAAAIEGLTETLSRDGCRLVYCEVHSEQLQAFGASGDDVATRLAECGFTTERVTDLPGARYMLRGQK